MFHKHILIAFQLLLVSFFGCSQKAEQARGQSASTQKHHYTNRLQHATSPYLLMHADNPVDWYPWGKEAFQKAKKEDKPIFLTIGYSTCYWCHVMERKDYMNKKIAEKMNKYFINIMVDREQRPDIDNQYMTAVRIMTGGGGWPLSVFLTPDLKPFFGATYIPPKGRNGRPGFGQLADRIHGVWKNQRQQLIKQADKVTQSMKQHSSPDLKPENINSRVLQTAFDSYADRFDSKYGGFGKAPKFPRPASLDFLLQYYKNYGNKKALNMATFTLQKMAAGGIYDHIGGGFHRYSTDKQWRVPHFEKMLYDQAQLVNTYLKAYQITGNKQFANTARRTLTFVNRVFYNAKGGFYSAMNAESPPPEHPKREPKEGAFYLWRKSAIARALPNRQAEITNYIYGVKKRGNAPNDPRGAFKGENILYRAHSDAEAARQFDTSREKIHELLKNAKQTLFNTRKQRPKPFVDHKILLSWNGLMISAYANAYRMLGDKKYEEAAVQSVHFLMNKLYNAETGQLKRSYSDGKAQYAANLVDYTDFVRGLMDLYLATHNKKWLNKAVQLTNKQNELFYDASNGGFFDTTMKGKKLLVRSKTFYDGTRPSGNSVAITNLIRLAKITGNEVFKKKAIDAMQYFGTYLNKQPSAMPQMLVGLALSL